MNKQIEEMARVACVGFHEGDCEHCPRHGFCSSYTVSRKLYHKGWRKSTDVAREIFEEIEKRLAMYSHIHRYAEEAKKVTEEYADGSPVEMTSVWDACRLEHNGYDDYETMCQLQDNIGNIEKSRLLKEFECDIAQLKKKYESEGADDDCN